MLGGTCVQIQWDPRTGSPAAPLFLIHDGSGVAFNYSLFDSLDRDVFGINDPLFGTDESHEGGIPSMARQYASFIKAEACNRPVLLGGWSLGGYISLEIVPLLQEEMQVSVLGVVLIDSPCPSSWNKLRHKMDEYEPDLPSTISDGMRKAIKGRMDKCDELVYDWILPLWIVSQRNPTESEASSREFFYHTLQSETFKIEIKLDEESGTNSDRGSDSSAFDYGRPAVYSFRSTSEQQIRTPVTLLRATDSIPRPTSRPKALYAVDLARESKMLGWEFCHNQFIKEVYEIRGNHFSIFDNEEKVKSASQVLRLACNSFES